MAIVYNNEVTIKPDYLEIEFYKEIVQNALLLKNPSILKVNCSMGSKTGENYCSLIYRVNIQFINKENTKVDTISVIIKSMPKSEAADFLESLNTYLKERTIYYEILPRLEVLLDKSQRFGPRIYHNLENPVNTLVFEDLAVSKFRMASREQGLNEVHARLILKRLAQLHASSMVLAKEQPKIVENLSTGMLAPAGLASDNGMLMRFFSTCAATMISEVSKWPQYNIITIKLKNYVANLRKNLIASQAPMAQDKVKVLNHGDLWVNNMLFQYDTSDMCPVNVIFLDFQMSFYGSPGIDLNYFFYSSLQLDLLKFKRIELLQTYHHELCAALEKMNYSYLKPTLEQVLNEFQQRQSHGFFATFCLLPTISLDKNISQDNNLENFLDEDFTRKRIELMFQSKRVQETLKYTLKEFDKLGIWN